MVLPFAGGPARVHVICEKVLIRFYATGHGSGGRGPHNLQGREPQRSPPITIKGGRKCMCGTRARMTQPFAQKHKPRRSGFKERPAPTTPPFAWRPGPNHRHASQAARGPPNYPGRPAGGRVCPAADNTALRPCSSTVAGYFFSSFWGRL